jgi:Uma2 family endonuclease
MSCLQPTNCFYLPSLKGGLLIESKTMEVRQMTDQAAESIQSLVESTIVYPESDGEPLGETESHVIATLHLYDALRHHFRDQMDVYVASNMFLYYEEGNPSARKAPDVMVVKGVEKRNRRTFKVWEEKAAPQVIFEITSRSTWMEDLVTKSTVYASLGVVEYFLFDPLREYLDQPLKGFHLRGKEYAELEPNDDRSLSSTQLGVILRPQEDLLRVVDAQTGEVIPALDEAILRTEQEMERARREAERADQEAERARQETERARQEAEKAIREAQRADAAENEAARLRALVEQLKGAATDAKGS